MYKNGKPVYNKIFFNEEQTKDIITSYLNKESSVKIGKRYGVNHHVILNLLHENNIEVSQRKMVRKYSLNENYFDSIDNPNKAYILGFLYADGHNGISKSTITISLQEEDFEILEKIRIEIGSEKPLEFLDYSKKDDFGYSYKNQYRLNMFSKHMCESLEKIGMISNKSLVLEFPNIPEELYSHFIRGYFDGDGSISHYQKPNGKYQHLLTITSTDLFCNKIKEIISLELDIPCGNIYDASCHNGITKVLSVSGDIQVKKILDWLYKDAGMYLKRKYDKYLNWFNINNSLIA